MKATRLFARRLRLAIPLGSGATVQATLSALRNAKFLGTNSPMINDKSVMLEKTIAQASQSAAPSGQNPREHSGWLANQNKTANQYVLVVPL